MHHIEIALPPAIAFLERRPRACSYARGRGGDSIECMERQPKYHAARQIMPDVMHRRSHFSDSAVFASLPLRIN